MNTRLPALTLAALALLFVLAIIAFSVGRFAITPSELLTVLWAKLSGGTHELPSTYEVNGGKWGQTPFTL